jgi:hypothetical protein
LDQSNDGIIEHTPELGTDIIPYFLGSFLLDGFYAFGFDVDLIHYGNRAIYTPGGAVICGFIEKYGPTGLCFFLILYLRMVHVKNDFLFFGMFTKIQIQCQCAR